ncbi:c-type cytochrome [Ruegeria profundi]|uniref:c-type cytochrome n=1 Tax=Ruegeria profundi TaxID=1685378 RepID=UPI001CD7D772|nr:c-type cytochrome [Ruegeria profundi]MCA0929442.1 cytochrome C [Ruegeria profundi]
MKRALATAIVGLLALPAYAEGDAEAGKKAFNRCKSCHMIATPDGDVIVKGGRTGPNLYGIAGRTAGTVEDFRYGDSLVAAGENGLVWDEATFAEYAQDPKEFLKSYLDDTAAKSKMSFKLKSGGEDVYAYIASLSAE